jgi:hypothetical protein
MIPLSERENHFTISSAGKYNLALVSPNENPDLIHEMKHPIQRGNLLPLPDTGALSAWEQPDKLMKNTWNPFSSKEDFLSYLKVISINLRSTRHFHFGLDLGAFLLLILFFLFFKDRNLLMNFIADNFILILTCMTCTGLYCLVLAVHRYLWINDVVILILFTKLFSSLRWPEKILFPLVILAIVLVTFEPVTDLAKNINGDKTLYQTCQKIVGNHLLEGNLASLDIGESEQSYHNSSIVAYLTKQKYFGMISQYNFDRSGVNEIKRFGVKHLLVWNEKTELDRAKFNMKKDFYPEINLSVYTLVDIMGDSQGKSNLPSR